MQIIRNLLLASIFLFGSAHANDYEFLVAKNKMGGQIMLSFIDCPIEGLSGAKAAVIVQGSDRIYGCWVLVDTQVHAIWFNQGEVAKVEYDIRLFKKELVI